MFCHHSSCCTHINIVHRLPVQPQIRSKASQNLSPQYPATKAQMPTEPTNTNAPTTKEEANSRQSPIPTNTPKTAPHVNCTQKLPGPLLYSSGVMLPFLYSGPIHFVAGLLNGFPRERVTMSVTLSPSATSWTSTSPRSNSTGQTLDCDPVLELYDSNRP